MLNELDGIEVLKEVFVLAATNAPWSLDPALMRPGRLDQLLYVGPPDQTSREEIWKIKLGKVRCAEPVDSAKVWLAECTEGYTGAEIAAVCQGAGYAALAQQVETGARVHIERHHLEQALAEVPKQVTSDMVESYEKWGKNMGR